VEFTAYLVIGQPAKYLSLYRGWATPQSTCPFIEGGASAQKACPDVARRK
jgi:hypothetical protein